MAAIYEYFQQYVGGAAYGVVSQFSDGQIQNTAPATYLAPAAVSSYVAALASDPAASSAMDVIATNTQIAAAVASYHSDHTGYAWPYDGWRTEVGPLINRVLATEPAGMRNMLTSIEGHIEGYERQAQATSAALASMMSTSTATATSSMASSNNGTSNGTAIAGTATTGGGGGLSEGAKIGIGVGVGVGVPILIAILVIIFFYCCRRGAAAAARGTEAGTTTTPMAQAGGPISGAPYASAASSSATAAGVGGGLVGAGAGRGAAAAGNSATGKSSTGVGSYGSGYNGVNRSLAGNAASAGSNLASSGAGTQAAGVGSSVGSKGLDTAGAGLAGGLVGYGASKLANGNHESGAGQTGSSTSAAQQGGGIDSGDISRGLGAGSAGATGYGASKAATGTGIGQSGTNASPGSAIGSGSQGYSSAGQGATDSSTLRSVDGTPLSELFAGAGAGAAASTAAGVAGSKSNGASNSGADGSASSNMFNKGLTGNHSSTGLTSQDGQNGLVSDASGVNGTAGSKALNTSSLGQVDTSFTSGSQNEGLQSAGANGPATTGTKGSNIGRYGTALGLGAGLGAGAAGLSKVDRSGAEPSYTSQAFKDIAKTANGSDLNQYGSTASGAGLSNETANTASLGQNASENISGTSRGQDTSNVGALDGFPEQASTTRSNVQNGVSETIPTRSSGNGTLGRDGAATGIGAGLGAGAAGLSTSSDARSATDTGSLNRSAGMIDDKDATEYTSTTSRTSTGVVSNQQQGATGNFAKSGLTSGSNMTSGAPGLNRTIGSNAGQYGALTGAKGLETSNSSSTSGNGLVSQNVGDSSMAQNTNTGSKTLNTADNVSTGKSQTGTSSDSVADDSTKSSSSRGFGTLAGIAGGLGLGSLLSKKRNSQSIEPVEADATKQSKEATTNSQSGAKGTPDKDTIGLRSSQHGKTQPSEVQDYSAATITRDQGNQDQASTSTRDNGGLAGKSNTSEYGTHGVISSKNLAKGQSILGSDGYQAIESDNARTRNTTSGIATAGSGLVAAGLIPAGSSQTSTIRTVNDSSNSHSTSSNIQTRSQFFSGIHRGVESGEQVWVWRLRNDAAFDFYGRLQSNYEHLPGVIYGTQSETQPGTRAVSHNSTQSKIPALLQPAGQSTIQQAYEPTTKQPISSTNKSVLTPPRETDGIASRTTSFTPSDQSSGTTGDNLVTARTLPQGQTVPRSDESTNLSDAEHTALASSVPAVIGAGAIADSKLARQHASPQLEGNKTTETGALAATLPTKDVALNQDQDTIIDNTKPTERSTSGTSYAPSGNVASRFTESSKDVTDEEPATESATSSSKNKPSGVLSGALSRLGFGSKSGKSTQPGEMSTPVDNKGDLTSNTTGKVNEQRTSQVPVGTISSDERARNTVTSTVNDTPDSTSSKMVTSQPLVAGVSIAGPKTVDDNIAKTVSGLAPVQPTVSPMNSTEAATVNVVGREVPLTTSSDIKSSPANLTSSTTTGQSTSSVHDEPLLSQVAKSSIPVEGSRVPFTTTANRSVVPEQAITKSTFDPTVPGQFVPASGTVVTDKVDSSNLTFTTTEQTGQPMQLERTTEIIGAPAGQSAGEAMLNDPRGSKLPELTTVTQGQASAPQSSNKPQSSIVSGVEFDQNSSSLQPAIRDALSGKSQVPRFLSNAPERTSNSSSAVRSELAPSTRAIVSGIDSSTTNAPTTQIIHQGFQPVHPSIGRVEGIPREQGLTRDYYGSQAQQSTSAGRSDIHEQSSPSHAQPAVDIDSFAKREQAAEHSEVSRSVAPIEGRQKTEQTSGFQTVPSTAVRHESSVPSSAPLEPSNSTRYVQNSTNFHSVPTGLQPGVGRSVDPPETSENTLNATPDGESAIPALQPGAAQGVSYVTGSGSQIAIGSGNEPGLGGCTQNSVITSQVPDDKISQKAKATSHVETSREALDSNYTTQQAPAAISTQSTEEPQLANLHLENPQKDVAFETYGRIQGVVSHGAKISDVGSSFVISSNAPESAASASRQTVTTEKPAEKRKLSSSVPEEPIRSVSAGQGISDAVDHATLPGAFPGTTESTLPATPGPLNTTTTSSVTERVPDQSQVTSRSISSTAPIDIPHSDNRVSLADTVGSLDTAGPWSPTSATFSVPGDRSSASSDESPRSSTTGSPLKLSTYLAGAAGALGMTGIAAALAPENSHGEQTESNTREQPKPAPSNEEALPNVLQTPETSQTASTKANSTLQEASSLEQPESVGDGKTVTREPLEASSSQLGSREIASKTDKPLEGRLTDTTASEKSVVAEQSQVPSSIERDLPSQRTTVASAVIPESLGSNVHTSKATPLEPEAADAFKTKEIPVSLPSTTANIEGKVGTEPTADTLASIQKSSGKNVQASTVAPLEPKSPGTFVSMPTTVSAPSSSAEVEHATSSVQPVVKSTNVFGTSISDEQTNKAGDLEPQASDAFQSKKIPIAASQTSADLERSIKSESAPNDSSKVPESSTEEINTSQVAHLEPQSPGTFATKPMTVSAPSVSGNLDHASSDVHPAAKPTKQSSSTVSDGSTCNSTSIEPHSSHAFASKKAPVSLLEKIESTSSKERTISTPEAAIDRFIPSLHNALKPLTPIVSDVSRTETDKNETAGFSAVRPVETSSSNNQGSSIASPQEIVGVPKALQQLTQPSIASEANEKLDFPNYTTSAETPVATPSKSEPGSSTTALTSTNTRVPADLYPTAASETPRITEQRSAVVDSEVPVGKPQSLTPSTLPEVREQPQKLGQEVTASEEIKVDAGPVSSPIISSAERSNPEQVESVRLDADMSSPRASTNLVDTKEPIHQSTNQQSIDKLASPNQSTPLNTSTRDAPVQDGSSAGILATARETLGQAAETTVNKARELPTTVQQITSSTLGSQSDSTAPDISGSTETSKGGVSGAAIGGALSQAAATTIDKARGLPGTLQQLATSNTDAESNTTARETQQDESASNRTNDTAIGESLSQVVDNTINKARELPATIRESTALMTASADDKQATKSSRNATGAQGSSSGTIAGTEVGDVSARAYDSTVDRAHEVPTAMQQLTRPSERSADISSSDKESLQNEATVVPVSSLKLASQSSESAVPVGTSGREDQSDSRSTLPETTSTEQSVSKTTKVRSSSQPDESTVDRSIDPDLDVPSTQTGTGFGLYGRLQGAIEQVSNTLTGSAVTNRSISNQLSGDESNVDREQATSSSGTVTSSPTANIGSQQIGSTQTGEVAGSRSNRDSAVSGIYSRAQAALEQASSSFGADDTETSSTTISSIIPESVTAVAATATESIRHPQETLSSITPSLKSTDTTTETRGLSSLAPEVAEPGQPLAADSSTRDIISESSEGVHQTIEREIPGSSVQTNEGTTTSFAPKATIVEKHQASSDSPGSLITRYYITHLESHGETVETGDLKEMAFDSPEAAQRHLHKLVSSHASTTSIGTNPQVMKLEHYDSSSPSAGGLTLWGMIKNSLGYDSNSAVTSETQQALASKAISEHVASTETTSESTGTTPSQVVKVAHYESTSPEQQGMTTWNVVQTGSSEATDLSQRRTISTGTEENVVVKGSENSGSLISEGITSGQHQGFSLNSKEIVTGGTEQRNDSSSQATKMEAQPVIFRNGQIILPSHNEESTTRGTSSSTSYEADSSSQQVTSSLSAGTHEFSLASREIIIPASQPDPSPELLKSALSSQEYSWYLSGWYRIVVSGGQKRFIVQSRQFDSSSVDRDAGSEAIERLASTVSTTSQASGGNSSSTETRRFFTSNAGGQLDLEQLKQMLPADEYERLVSSSGARQITTSSSTTGGEQSSSSSGSRQIFVTGGEQDLSSLRSMLSPEDFEKLTSSSSTSRVVTTNSGGERQELDLSGMSSEEIEKLTLGSSTHRVVTTTTTTTSSGQQQEKTFDLSGLSSEQVAQLASSNSGSTSQRILSTSTSTGAQPEMSFEEMVAKLRESEDDEEESEMTSTHHHFTTTTTSTTSGGETVTERSMGSVGSDEFFETRQYTNGSMPASFSNSSEEKFEDADELTSNGPSLFG